MSPNDREHWFQLIPQPRPQNAFRRAAPPLLTALFLLALLWINRPSGSGFLRPLEEGVQIVDRRSQNPFWRLLTAWHFDRNRHNQQPAGSLRPKTGAAADFAYSTLGDNLFIDEAGHEWLLLPDHLNEFHQPPGHKQSERPYPNKKFLHRHTIASSEAIVQQDGSYLTTGSLQATYNYVDPDGILSAEAINHPAAFAQRAFTQPAAFAVALLRDLAHGLLDVLPHILLGDGYTLFPRPPDNR